MFAARTRSIRPGPGVRVLMLDDSEADADRVRETLRRAGETPTVVRVADGATFRARLEDGWDAVLAEGVLATWNPVDALEAVRETKGPPFILFCREGTEKVLEAVMRKGAYDYLLKDDAERLPAVLRRAARDRGSVIPIAVPPREFLGPESSEILDHLPFEVLGFDGSGRIGYANDAARDNLRIGADIVGRDVRALVSPDARERHRAATASLLEGGSDEASFEAERVRADGTSYPVRVRLVAFGRAGGPRFLEIAEDLTERQRLAAEREEALRETLQIEKLTSLGRLAAGLVHEIRTPLTYVTNHIFLSRRRLEALARNGTPADKTREIEGLLAEAAAGVDRITALLREFRLFVKETKKPIMRDVSKTVHDAVELFRKTTPGGVPVIEDLDPTPMLLHVPREIEQVALNLLTNAAEAAPGRTIRVRCRSVPGGVEVSVEDEGAGVPADVAPHIFEPFVTTKPEGMGVGLSIVSRVVTGYGGRIDVQSVSPHGARFVVFLPHAVPRDP